MTETISEFCIRLIMEIFERNLYRLYEYFEFTVYWIKDIKNKNTNYFLLFKPFLIF